MRFGFSFLEESAAHALTSFPGAQFPWEPRPRGMSWKVRGEQHSGVPVTLRTRRPTLGGDSPSAAGLGRVLQGKGCRRQTQDLGNGPRRRDSDTCYSERSLPEPS